MKILGITAEYNPFHTGHEEQIQIARREAGADCVIAVMSASFVQRGEPAVYDKYVRTKLALLGGADIVFELPAPFSAAAAGDFAAAGVSLLESLGADILCFGSECGSLEDLSAPAEVLSEEPPEFRSHLQALLKEGKPFPEARAEALSSILSREDISALLKAPNNILGLEYLLAMKKINSRMAAFTHRRKGADYHQGVLPEETSFASATALRSCLLAGEPEKALPFLPKEAEQVLHGERPLCADDFSLLLDYTLLRGLPSTDDIEGFDQSLSDRLRGMEPEAMSFSERVLRLKSKNYTETRIRRALLHLLLGIRKEDVALWKENLPGYGRILGFRKEAAPFLKEIKKRAAVPLIAKTADAKSLLSPAAYSLFEKEVEAAHIYQTVRAGKGLPFRNEYRQGPVILSRP